jgi:hypothetical protein
LQVPQSLFSGSESSSGGLPGIEAIQQQPQHAAQGPQLSWDWPSLANTSKPAPYFGRAAPDFEGGDQQQQRAGGSLEYLSAAQYQQPPLEEPPYPQLGRLSLGWPPSPSSPPLEQGEAPAPGPLLAPAYSLFSPSSWPGPLLASPRPGGKFLLALVLWARG